MMFALLFQYISLSKKQIRVLIMTLMCFPKRRRRFDSTSEVYATTVSSSIAVAIAVFLFDHEFVVVPGYRVNPSRLKFYQPQDLLQSHWVCSSVGERTFGT